MIPPKHDGEFVAAMEDVLDVYQQPYDPAAPVVCMDETSKQLVGEVRRPVPPAPGRPARVDYEYERQGTANIFLFTEPLQGWRWTSVTQQRARRDWAQAVRTLLDVHYPEAKGRPSRHGQPQHPTESGRSTRPSNRRRRAASPCAWRSITLRSTGAGSTSLRSSCEPSRSSVSTDVCRNAPTSVAKSRPGIRPATNPPSASDGDSRLPTLASDSVTSIHRSTHDATLALGC